MQIDVVSVAFQVVVFLFAISVHESAHAWTAARFGDLTATLLGRVSLNPIRHIDPIGTVMLPFIALMYHVPMIGWAKPTPVDPRNFRGNEVLADIATSVMGPISNLLVASAAVLGMLLISLASTAGRGLVMATAYTYGQYLPEGDSLLNPVVLLLYLTMEINILLAVFNLIPVPPLDGSHVLRHLLPEGARRVYDNVGIFGMLLLFIAGGPLIRSLVAPVMYVFNSLLMRV